MTDEIFESGETLDFNDVYEKENTLLEDDEIDGAEEGFMLGYMSS